MADTDLGTGHSVASAYLFSLVLVLSVSINILVLYWLKAGFHTCVITTHNGAPCLSMYEHHCSETIAAFAIEACMLATKSHMLNFCKACAMICCDCDLQEPIAPPKKRTKFKTKNITTTFWKLLFLTRYRMRYAPNTKDLVRNLMMVAYMKPAKRNNVCTSKQLGFVASTETFNEN